MFSWLLENLATMIIGIMLFALIVLITVRMVRNKSKGKSSCGCGCSACPAEGACHRKK